MQEATRLTRKNGAPIPPVGTRFTFDSDLVTFEFDVPKSEPIALGDGEVEFITVVRQNEIQARFRQRAMVIGDRLAL